MECYAFNITTDTPYLALTGELWGVFCGDLVLPWKQYHHSSYFVEFCCAYVPIYLTQFLMYRSIWPNSLCTDLFDPIPYVPIYLTQFLMYRSIWPNSLCTDLFDPIPYVPIYLTQFLNTLMNEMNNISQTTFSNVFSSMKMCKFRWKFHWSLFPRVQLTIFQHWFR